MITSFIKYTSALCLCLFVAMSFVSCAFRGVSRHKNISYQQADAVTGKTAQQLNVFSPHHKKSNDVLIFVYGGNWNTGKKKLYSFFGNRMARKNVVTVIVDYPKSPAANYNDMALAVAQAVKWVQNNIDQYGGDPGKIFISGHSAGGHLAGLVGINNAFFDTVGIKNPLKGIILIDAAGLDMYSYLKEENFEPGNTYLQTFTNDPVIWKAASPIYFLHASMPPLLIYQGGKTYPSIAAGNEKFVAALKKYVPQPAFHLQPRKKHVAMITQFFNTSNPRYKEIISFMKMQR